MRMNVCKLVSLLLLTGALTACGGGWPGLDTSSTAVSVRNQLPEPDATVTSADFTNYRIGPSDELSVEVFGAPDLKRDGQVDAAGNFSMPLVGNLKVGGRTPDEAGRLLADRLRGHLIKDPQVTVTVVKANPQMVTVDGAVGQPGQYPITGKTTLQQAIASAKGASDMANLTSVVVFRTVNNQKLAALFNLKEIRAGRLADPQVYGNDVIVVGESATRRFLRDLSIFPRLGSFVPFGVL